MANNPYVNKVVYGNQTVIDISDTTADPADVADGEVFYDRSGQRSVGTGNYYSPADTAETDIDDADYFPFYDTSASGKRKSLWSNVKAKLKAYFDTLYKGISAHDAWTDVTSKPFETINSGSFTVTDGDLRINGNRVYALTRRTPSDGSATSIGGRGISGNYRTSTGGTSSSSAYVYYVMKQTDNALSYVFTNSTYITGDIFVDVYSSIYGESPTNVVVDETAHTVTVTFAEAKSRDVAIVFF